MRRTTFLSGASAAAVIASRATIASAQSATVKIGYVESLSGALSDIGQHHRAGVEAAIAEMNARGRTKFELVVADDASSPPIGGTAARRLITQENVDALLVGTSSAVTLAVGPIAEQAGIFALAIGGQDTSITGERAQSAVYRFAPNVRMQVKAVSQRILAQGKKWYFIVDDFAYGKDSYARLSAVLKRAGGEEVGADILALGTADYSSSLTKLRNSGADVLVLCQGGFDGAKTAKQFVDFGLAKKIHLAGMSGSMEDYYWKSVPTDALVGSTFAINWAPSASDSAMRISRKLAKMIPDAIGGRHIFGYVCATQLMERMHAAGTTKADALVKAFADHSFESYKGTTSVWRGCDHQCVQDVYAGAIVSTKQREKSGFMFEIVGDIPGTQAAGTCGDAEATAATAAMAKQTIGERSSYTPKPVA